MFVFYKVVFRKLVFKFFCVCLLLEKIVMENTFWSKKNTFWSIKNTFRSKKNLTWFFRKVFFLLAVFVFRKVVSGKSLSKLLCVCLPLEKLVNGKHFLVKEKFGRKTLSGSCEKFRNVIICWLYQILSSNFWLLYIFYFEYLFFNFIS